MAVKPTREVLKNMEAREERQAAQLVGLQVMAEKFDAEFWLEVSRRLKLRRDAFKAERETDFWKHSEIQRFVIKAREETLEEVLDMPRTVGSAYGLLKKENNDLKRKILEYRRGLKKSGV